MTLPKTTDPALPAIGGLGYVGEADASSYVTVASGVYYKNASNLWVPVSASNPLPAKTIGDATRIASAPVTGVKTVTSVAAEIFAGASRKAGRSLLIIRNLDPAIRIRIGPSAVTDTTGFGVEPGAVLTLYIDPTADVPIYAISEAGNVSVEVFEA